MNNIQLYKKTPVENNGGLVICFDIPAQPLLAQQWLAQQRLAQQRLAQRGRMG
jgi:hypothetical protein